jgi:hypothetical protein
VLATFAGCVCSCFVLHVQPSLIEGAGQEPARDLVQIRASPALLEGFSQRAHLDPSSSRSGQVRCSRSTRRSNSGPYSDPAKEELIRVFLLFLSFLFYFLLPSYIHSLTVFLSTLKFAKSLLSCWIHFFLDLSARTEVRSVFLY